MLQWLILYSDGSRFSSFDGEPHEAPRQEVQFIIMEDPDTGTRAEASPIGFWGWRDGEWNGFEDHMGFWSYMFNSGEPITAVFGRTLKNSLWEALIKEASEIEMGIRKFGWRKYERRP